MLLGRNELAFRYHLSIEDLVEFIKIDFGINRILTPSLVGSCSKRTISPIFKKLTPTLTLQLLSFWSSRSVSPSPVDYYDNMLIGTMKLRIKNEGITFSGQRDLLSAENC